MKPLSLPDSSWYSAGISYSKSGRIIGHEVVARRCVKTAGSSYHSVGREIWSLRVENTTMKGERLDLMASGLADEVCEDRVLCKRPASLTQGRDPDCKLGMGLHVLKEF